MTLRRARRELPRAALIAGAYFLIARASLLSTFEPGDVASFWPASGFLLAMLVRSRRSMWPLVLLAVFPASALASLAAGKTVFVSIGAAAAHAVFEPWCGAELIRRNLAARRNLNVRRTILGLFLPATLTAAISATVGGTVTVSATEGASLAATWWIWWGAVFVGILVVAPLILFVDAGALRRFSTEQRGERLALFAVLLAVSGFIFGTSEPQDGGSLPLLYAAFPLLIWSALRFPAFESALALLTLAIVSMVGTALGRGPIARIPGGPAEAAIWLQAFLAVAALTTWTLAAVISERRRAEQRLSASEERFRRYFELGHIGLAIASADCRWVHVNDGLCEMLGCTSDQLKRTTLLEVIAPEDRTAVQSGFDRMLAAGRDRLSAEPRLMRRSGTTVPVVLSAACVRGEDGQPVQFVLIVVNDSKRRNSEQATRLRIDQQDVLLELARASTADTEAFLRRVTEADASLLGVGRVGVWVFDGDGDALECLDEYDAESERHSVGETLALGAADAYLAAPQTSRCIAASDARHDPRTCAFHERLLSPRGIDALLDVPLRVHGDVIGVVRHAHTGSVRVWTPEDQAFAASIADLVGLSIESAERRQAEASLRESEERFRQLAENIHEVFWVIEWDTRRLLYVSPAYETIWGRTRDYLAGDLRNWARSIHPEDRARIVAEFERSAESGSYDVEYRIVRPDGGIRWIRDEAVPIRDENGVVYRMAGIARNVTRRRQLEDQLRYSQKMEAIGKLAGGVAHDFNNILTAVLGNVELLLSQCRDASVPREQMLTELEQIDQSAHRAAALTRQLLAFSRRQVLKLRVLDLNRVVEDVEPMLRQLLGEEVRLVLEKSPKLWRVMADAAQLEQVMINLALNARDAMPGGGTVRLRTANISLDEVYALRHPGAHAGPNVELDVSDSGEGISPDVREHIFEPFFTTKPVGKGTGLGLATVLGIVQQTGGHIDVHSTPGSGCRFSVFLPAEVDRDASIRSPILSGADESPRTLLVCEDDDAVRNFTCDTLERAGYHVLRAAHAEQAMALGAAFDGNIAALVSDVIMPGMKGPKLADLIRRRFPEIRVLFVSGYSEGVIDTGDYANHEFLEKPFSSAALLECVRRMLDHPKPARS